MENCPVLKGEMLFRPGESVYIHKSTEMPEYVGVVHKHNFIEIVYIISGERLHINGRKTIEASKGDLFIINYQTPHGFIKKENSTEEFIAYDCVFTPDFLDISLLGNHTFQDINSSFLFYSLFPEKCLAAPDLHLVGAGYTEFGDLFSKMYNEYKCMQKGYNNIIRAYIIELIIKIFRRMDDADKNVISKKQLELVSLAIDYLKTHFNTNLKLETLALKSFLSKNYFGKLFKDITGSNFSVYIQKLRIDEACKLLRDTDMKIIDIALQCGFNDLKFFYSVFKSITGKTPGNYRKE